MSLLQERIVSLIRDKHLYNTMAREIESVHQFTHDPKFRLGKEMCVIRCDDRTVYQFEKPVDRPDRVGYRLVKAFQPDGSVSHQGARKILPDAVEETVETLLGGWSK